ncbi:hypothetical protein D9M68_801450 [compost metagenome]
MPVDMRVQGGQGQALRARQFAALARQAGQQQRCALLGDYRVIDRAGRQPTDQLALRRVEAPGAGAFEQAAAGIGMQAQVLLQPVLRGHVEHQAPAAAAAAAGMLRRRRHHGEGLADHLTAQPGYFEVQLATQAEDQLRMIMAVAEQFMAVVTQRERRRHGRFLVAGGQFSRPLRLFVAVRCHRTAMAPSQSFHRRQAGS